jgi:hypothetical protein
MYVRIAHEKLFVRDGARIRRGDCRPAVDILALNQPLYRPL